MKELQALQTLVYAEDAPARTEALRAAGLEQSARYLPERIVPQWAAFLRGLTGGGVNVSR